MDFGSENLKNNGTSLVDFDDEEMFFEFLEKRPIWRFLFILITLAATLFGLFSNLMILYVKLRRFKERNIFEWLVMCIVIGMIAHSFNHLILLLHVTNYGITSANTCYLEHISSDFSNPMIIYSSIIPMTLIKFNPQISKPRGFMLIAVLWICILFASYPFYEIYVLEMPTGSSYNHNICIVLINRTTFGLSLEKFAFKMYFEFVIPSFIILIFFFACLLFKTPKVVQHLDIWTYVILIGMYFCITSIPVKFNMLFFYHNGISFMNSAVAYINAILMMLILVISPLVYLYCNRKFYREFCETFMIWKRKDDETMEIFWEGEAVFVEN